jgi:DNA-binding MarR family transcriptional regulator
VILSEDGYRGVVTEPLRFPDRFLELFPEVDVLAAETLMNLMRLADLTSEGFDRIARPEGLSISGVEVLRMLALHGGPLTSAEIASGVFVTTATITTVLATLERRGLIEREPHPTDGRKILMHLTPEAEALLARVMKEYLAMTEKLMAALSTREQETLQSFLTRLLAVADQDAQSPSNHHGVRRDARRS